MTKRLLMLLIVAATGAALSLAFPRVSFWPIAWVGLTPLLIVLRGARPAKAAALGLAFGLGFFGALLSWVGVFGYAPWILLALIESLSVCLFGVLASIAYRSRRQWLVLLAVPALWTAIDWLRSLGSLGFPWGYLAYSQAQNLPVVQITSLTGPWGLTFLIVLFSAALASPKARMLRSLAVAVVAVAVVYSGGQWAMNRDTPPGERIPVAVLQGAVDEDPRAPARQLRDQIVRVYTGLSREAAQRRPNLVVWPESSVPGDVIKNLQAREWLLSIARASRACILAGGPHYIPASGSRPATNMNGAHMVSPDGDLSSYYKVQLAPFGEFVPARKWLPFLDRYSPREADIMPGTKHNLLPAEFAKLGVMICFESAFPAIARRETADGADLLCVITREVFFGRTALAAQHHDMAVLRAVENGRCVVRSAESGISSIIDPRGRVLTRLGLWERGVLHGEVEPRKGLTIYSRFGDWFVYLCCLTAVLGVGSGLASRRKS